SSSATNIAAWVVWLQPISGIETRTVTASFGAIVSQAVNSGAPVLSSSVIAFADRAPATAGARDPIAIPPRLAPLATMMVRRLIEPVRAMDCSLTRFDRVRRSGGLGTPSRRQPAG